MANYTGPAATSGGIPPNMDLIAALGEIEELRARLAEAEAERDASQKLFVEQGKHDERELASLREDRDRLTTELASALSDCYKLAKLAALADFDTMDEADDATARLQFYLREGKRLSRAARSGDATGLEGGSNNG